MDRAALSSPDEQGKRERVGARSPLPSAGQRWLTAEGIAAGVLTVRPWRRRYVAEGVGLEKWCASMRSAENSLRFDVPAAAHRRSIQRTIAEGTANYIAKLPSAAGVDSRQPFRSSVEEGFPYQHLVCHLELGRAEDARDL